MPTNILRKSGRAAFRTPERDPRKAKPRRLLIRVGSVVLPVELNTSQTADRIWTQLPLFSTAERWGDAVHFEVPVETGRERGARTLALPGEVYFWVEDDRILIPFGATPISRPGEMRLPRPCNVWGKALDSVALLKVVAPGEKVSLTEA